MPLTVKSAFYRQHIEQVLELVAEYGFRLGVLEPPITLRIYRALDSSKYYCEQSHYASTPPLDMPQITHRPWHDSEAGAINQVVNALNEYYSEAIGKGHKPDSSWLTPNQHFGR